MYNTTTIPTILIPPSSIFYNLLSGFLLIMPFWGGIFHLIARYEKEHTLIEEEEDDEDKESEEEAEKEKYWDELNALADRELSNSDLTDLQSKMVRETLEFSTYDDEVNVAEDEGEEEEKKKTFDLIMHYDKDSESFSYYTDHLKEITYTTLEAVARKFVIEHNCKRLYIQPVQEHKATEHKDTEHKDTEHEQKDTEPVKSVFAKFKKYNTGTKGGLPNFSNESTKTDQMNHFRYKGKLYHYDETMMKKVIDKITIDYAEYKLLMLAKEK